MVHYQFATQEQKDLAKTAREILEKELKPRLEELEANNEFPRDVLKKLADAGYYGMGIPERWGGLGLDYVTQSIIYEEMAQIDAGFSFSFAIASYITNVLYTGISMAEKQQWIDRTLAGDVVVATALTEPNAGSDTKAIRTTAVYDEKTDEWVINGTKCFISNGGIADVVFVSAYVDKSKGAAGIAQFFVEKERGFQVGKTENKMGLKLSVTSELIFEDVRVPATHRVGSLAQYDPKEAEAMGLGKRRVGNSAILDSLAIARVTTMTHALGIQQAALDEAVKYAKERRTFGKRIIDHQGLGFLIADMQTDVDASRAILYHALECLDKGIPLGALSSTVKVFVSEATMRVTTNAVQVLGGYGYMKEYPVEKLMRDAKIFSIFEGTNEINRIVIQRKLAGRDEKLVK